ncbi:MAG: RidA family protein [Sphingobium sp.]
MSSVPVLPLSAIRRTGELVFVSGQLALVEGKITGHDIVTQTNIVIDAIKRELATQGLDLDGVVKTGVWLVSEGDFAAFNATYARRFAPPYPARSTVVSRLLIPGALIEIDAIARIQS